MKKIVVFASGSGSTFEYLVNQAGADYAVVGLFCNRRQAGVVQIANRNHIPVTFVSDSTDWQERLLELAPDLIVLAGYLKLIPRTVTKKFRVINTHPSLLPEFGGEGFFGHHVHEAVLNSGVNQTGVTIHWVDEAYDRGEIITQAIVEVQEADSVDSLSCRVQAIEKPLLHETIKKLLEEQ